MTHSLPSASVIFAFGQKYSLRFPYRSLRGKPHLGADYGRTVLGWARELPVGTPIIAPADCKQTRFRTDEKGGEFGRFIEIETIDGQFKIIYAHLSEIGVKRVGKLWEEGQTFCWSGNTGVSTLPHCHVQAYQKRNGIWVLVDPEWVFQQQQDPLDSLRRSVNALFRMIFEREPKADDTNYFLHRIGRDINDRDKLISVMKYWSKESDSRWSAEKTKVLG